MSSGLTGEPPRRSAYRLAALLAIVIPLTVPAASQAVTTNGSLHGPPNAVPSSAYVEDAESTGASLDPIYVSSGATAGIVVASPGAAAVGTVARWTTRVRGRITDYTVSPCRGNSLVNYSFDPIRWIAVFDDTIRACVHSVRWRKEHTEWHRVAPRDWTTTMDVYLRFVGRGPVERQYEVLDPFGADVYVWESRAADVTGTLVIHGPDRRIRLLPGDPARLGFQLINA
jgi:hypothetical protein